MKNKHKDADEYKNHFLDLQMLYEKGKYEGEEYQSK